MPTAPKRPKRPRDTNQLGKMMVDILTGEVETERLRLLLLGSSPSHGLNPDLAGSVPHRVQPSIRRELRDRAIQILVLSITSLLLNFTCFGRVLVVMTTV